MEDKMIFNYKTSATVAIMLLLLLTGCAVNKHFWGNANKGLILQYRLLENQKLTYKYTSDMLQVVDIMGQFNETESNKTITFTVTAQDIKDKIHQLDVMVDDMSAFSAGVQGRLDGDMSKVIGKSFTMTLSSLGKEHNLEEAEAIEYSLGSGGKRNIATDFQTVFPNLADKPIKIGDTWTTQDTVSEKTDNFEMNIFLTTTNTLTGYEIVDGLECAKITSESTGPFKGKAFQGGMNMDINAKTQVTDIWYFAYKKGYFVQTTSQGSADGTVQILGPRTMELPLTMEMTFTVKLIK